MRSFRFTILDLLFVMPAVAVACLAIRWIDLYCRDGPLGIVALASVGLLSALGLIVGVFQKSPESFSNPVGGWVMSAIIFVCWSAKHFISNSNLGVLLQHLTLFGWATASLLAWVLLFAGVAGLFQPENNRIARHETISAFFAVALSMGLAKLTVIPEFLSAFH